MKRQNEKVMGEAEAIFYDLGMDEEVKEATAEEVEREVPPALQRMRRTSAGSRSRRSG